MPNIIPEISRASISKMNRTIAGEFDHGISFGNLNNTNINLNKTTFRQRERISNSMNQKSHHNISNSTSNLLKPNLNQSFKKYEDLLGKGQGNTSMMHNSITNLSEIPNNRHKSTFSDMNVMNASNLKSTTSFRSHSNATKNKSFMNKTSKEEPRFLNSYEYKKIELKNEGVKELYNEVNRHGPNFQYCEKCNYKNLEYFKELRPEHAVKLLSFIKEYRKEHSYKL